LAVGLVTVIASTKRLNFVIFTARIIFVFGFILFFFVPRVRYFIMNKYR